MTTPHPPSKLNISAFSRKLFDKIPHDPFREVESKSKSEISSMKKREPNEIHTESSFLDVSVEPDFVNFGPTIKLSPPASTHPVSYTHTIIDPVDADPSMSPYDHKTNYLSPKPQLLDYRPKPQTELEDKFIMSSSFSDSEVTENTQSKESLKESEDVSSDETVKQEESLIILLLSTAFVSISVTKSLGIDHDVFGEFYEAYKLSELLESLSSINEFIYDVRGAHDLGQLQYFNLTILSDYIVVNQYPNVQFAVILDNVEVLVIEMDLRASRSSALASKATGFPITKIEVKLKMDDEFKMFDRIPHNNLVSLNTVVMAYALNGFASRLGGWFQIS
ncbi:unnamed protein product [Vicia faba]|uniref:Carbamoyl phosphate synthase ATP-binding domain-containing protein n=1 Tax=Vicia faba TaxID=3906 RepID=A0AAV0Z2K3_VICFA|nr:unnamed protein product [Vicia faba]